MATQRYVYSRFASRKLAELGLQNMHDVGDMDDQYPRIEWRRADGWCITVHRLPAADFDDAWEKTKAEYARRGLVRKQPKGQTNG